MLSKKFIVSFLFLLVNFLPYCDNSKNIRTTRQIDIDHVCYLVSIILLSEDELVQENARAELINIATESSQGRKVVIDEINSVIEKLDIEGRMVLDEKTFRFWQNVNIIFRRIKATEAIDILIKYIYCSNGLADENGSHHPAEDTLLSFGQTAVPKLSDTLLNSNNPIIKKRVALCLGLIGNHEAKLALQQALKVEADKEVKHYIQLALDTIERESR
jgi:hypothetical protein